MYTYIYVSLSLSLSLSLSCLCVRMQVGNDAAVLGFVGAPFTLASYIVEGGTSRTYSEVKGMAFGNPTLLHALLDKLTEGIITYVRYQADHGAQAVQLFDSWAGKLAPDDFDALARPYLERIIKEVKYGRYYEC